MITKEIITMDKSLTLLQDGERVFLLRDDGSYMSADEMRELATLMLHTAHHYGAAIDAYNGKAILKSVVQKIEKR